MPTIRIFKQYLRIPFIVLALIEGTLLFISVYAAAALRFGGDFQDVQHSVGELGPRALVFALIMLIGMGAMGLYQVEHSPRARSLVLRLGMALLLGWLGLSVLYYVWPALYSGRGLLALSAVLSAGFVFVVRPLFYRVVDDTTFKQRILVLGAGERATSLLERMPAQYRRHGFILAGFVPCGESRTMVAEDQRLDIPRGMLREYCEASQIEEIVVAVDDRRNAFCMHDLLECKLAGIDVIDLMTFYEREDGKVRLDMLHPGWLVFSDGCARGTVRLASKRTFDVVASSILLVLSLPIMLLTILAIKLEEGLRAPIFYRQTRVGEHNEEFELMKFRSMRTDAEKEGKPVWAQQNDTRVTRVGKFIRLVRIDELPQIFNVLKGEMSFVGPRPERPQFVGELSEKIPYYSERHCLKPGITGWAQIRYPYGASLDDARAKLEYDLYYVKNHTLLLDLYVLLCTAEVVLLGRGR